MAKVKFSDGSGFYTDFEGLIKIYLDDWNKTRKTNKKLREADFIKIHSLPQFEELYKTSTNRTVRLPFYQMIDFLKMRLKSLDFHFEYDLVEASAIADINDRLIYWKGRLNEYQRFIKSSKPIEAVILGGKYKSYDLAVLDQIDIIKTDLRFISSINVSSKSNKDKQHKAAPILWQDSPDKLKELYSLMTKKHKLFASETTYEQFETVFTKQQTDKPIQWIASVRLLAYFLDTFFKGQYWQSIAGDGELFLNIKGSPISSNTLSVSKYGYTVSGKPKGSEKIEEIYKAIKKH